MKKYLTILLVPLAAAIVNALLRPLLCIILPGLGGHIIFNVIRVVIWGFAGWRLTALGQYPIWKAALSGAILLLVDLPIIMGGWLPLEGEFRASGGVIVSYGMFWPVAALIAGIGGAIGKR